MKLLLTLCGTCSFGGIQLDLKLRQLLLFNLKHVWCTTMSCIFSFCEVKQNAASTLISSFFSSSSFLRFSTWLVLVAERNKQYQTCSISFNNTNAGKVVESLTFCFNRRVDCFILKPKKQFFSIFYNSYSLNKTIIAFSCASRSISILFWINSPFLSLSSCLFLALKLWNNDDVINHVACHVYM